MERRIQKIQKEEAEKKKLARAVKKNTPYKRVNPGFNRSSKSSSGDKFFNSLPKPTVFKTAWKLPFQPSDV